MSVSVVSFLVLSGRAHGIPTQTVKNVKSARLPRLAMVLYFELSCLFSNVGALTANTTVALGAASCLANAMCEQIFLS